MNKGPINKMLRNVSGKRVYLNYLLSKLIINVVIRCSLIHLFISLHVGTCIHAGYVIYKPSRPLILHPKLYSSTGNSPNSTPPSNAL